MKMNPKKIVKLIKNLPPFPCFLGFHKNKRVTSPALYIKVYECERCGRGIEISQVTGRFKKITPKQLQSHKDDQKDCEKYFMRTTP
jgi:hypothetical protein